MTFVESLRVNATKTVCHLRIGAMSHESQEICATCESQWQ